MGNWIPRIVTVFFVTAALSGCFGGDEDGGAGPEPDPASFTGEIYDRAIGNSGFRVASDVTAAGVALDSGSAAQLDVVDVVSADTEGAQDKATFILDARETNLNVVARLRQMSTGDALGQLVPHLAGDLRGGVAHYVEVFGSTLLGPANLPESTSFLYAAGMAQVKIGSETLPDNYPIFVVVSEGFHDETGAMQSAIDVNDIEMHVFITGTEETALPGVAEGFLYYYFETVGMEQMDDTEKTTVGADLVEPEVPNVPPVAVAMITKNETANWSAVKEADENLTVTLDASLSSDPDGELVVFVWKIFELNQTGNWSKPTEGEPLASGQTATYDFTAPGPKMIELVIRDDRGAIANQTVMFYIDQHRLYESPSNTHTDTASGGPDCRRDLNCFAHRVSVGHEAEAAVFVLKTSSTGPVSSPRLELYAPNAETDTDDPVASAAGTTLTVPGDKLTEVGTYTLQVWWQAAVGVSYTIDATIDYTPAELPPLPGTAAEGDAAEGEGEGEGEPEP